ncbi:MAG: non-canonical purine NTP pyrophosphatase [bacterium]|nr:non-canonical purine NTP pyrophosphatase [bacterium]
MDILIGTKNQYKATEMISFLGNRPGIIIHFWEELGLEIKVEENQPTLKKNAEKKAVEISKLTDWYILASDGGVDIPGLGKKWNILRNQRIVGEDKTDVEKAEKLLGLMKGLKGEKRRASYRLALALAKEGKSIWSTEQISDKGYISEKLSDKEIPPYRWMGHLWYYPQHQKVFNKLSEEEKKDVRKQAVGIKRNLRKAIEGILETNVS